MEGLEKENQENLRIFNLLLIFIYVHKLLSTKMNKRENINNIIIIIKD